MLGQTVAHFDILEKLGEGGMGVVWKARDLRLGRVVALKFLPADKLGDRERNERFIREAKAASSLNHPNIVTIYDIDTIEGSRLLAMEYIAGQTLDRRIGRKGLPVGDALELSVQVAGALATAHHAGIVHRDLKPANIMVTGTGLVKLLDFGIAKLAEPAPGNPDEQTKTLAAPDEPLTAEGTIVGTVAYMSPEQAQGKSVNARSDIFSFGAVLYEMLTGVRTFERDTQLATLGAILHEEPKPPTSMVPALPTELERIVSRCLRKDVNRRFQHMDDVRVALEDVQEESQSGRLPPPTALIEPRVTWRAAAAVLGTVIAAGAIWWTANVRQVSNSPPRFKLTRLTRDDGVALSPAISSDGKLVVYSSDRAREDNQDLWLQQIAGGEPVRLTRSPADEYVSGFSPDGSQILFSVDKDVNAAFTSCRRLAGRSGYWPKMERFRVFHPTVNGSRTQ
jgi:eukaryotic-like serine/threonine-protein kinase